MNPAHFIWRIAERYCFGYRTSPSDIARDYDIAAETYAETWETFAASISRTSLNKLTLPHEGKVLDLGCGTGMVLRHLRQRGFSGSYVGVDVSSGMLSKIPDEPGVELHQGTAQDLLQTFPTGAFSAVTAIWSWEYMNRKQLLPQLRRVLHRGGQIVLLANRRDTIPELKSAFLRLMSMHPTNIQKVFHLALRMPHSAAQMGHELRRVGFTVIDQSDGEQSRAHATASAAVAWGFHTGALAGTRCVLDFADLEERLAKVLENMQPAMSTYATTHRYACVSGVLEC